jgi:hypothetical protein
MIFFLPDYDCPWWFWLAGKVMSQRFLIVKDELLDNMKLLVKGIEDGIDAYKRVGDAIRSDP